MSETQDDLTPDPMSDVFTASLWSAPKNEHILRSFINAVRTDAGMNPIVTATVLNPFNIKEFVASKGVILDVRAKDEHKRLYDIEVQTSNHPAFPNRMLDYWSETFGSQLKFGLDYTELYQVLSIILARFRIFSELENIHTIFEIRAREKPSYVLTDAFQMHCLRVAEVLAGQLDKLACLCVDLQDWLNFFAFGGTLTEAEMSNLTNNNPIILEAYDEMHRFYANPETREKARQRRRFLADYNLGMNASMAEGQVRSIMAYLHHKFNEVPHEIEIKLHSIFDVVQLDQLLSFAFNCESLNEFSSHLR
jgi:predicted transposase/invertase (TIGR01784 family)